MGESGKVFYDPKKNDAEDALHMASDFLTGNTAPRKSARLSSALLNYRRPDGLNLVPLGSSWALDVFARLHNGIRRELIDLYNMIDSMQKRIQDLRTADLNMFFSWWDMFSSYMEVACDAHEKVLIPWVTKRGRLPDALDETARLQLTGKVREMLAKFDTVYSQLNRRPPDETMAKIIKALVDMHPIVECLENFENYIPTAIEENYKHKDARTIEKKLASFLNKTGDSDFRRMHLCVVSRGMTEDVLSAWQRLLPPLIRLSYRSHTNKFTETHLSIVRKLASE